MMAVYVADLTDLSSRLLETACATSLLQCRWLSHQIFAVGDGHECTGGATIRKMHDGSQLPPLI